MSNLLFDDISSNRAVFSLFLKRSVFCYDNCYYFTAYPLILNFYAPYNYYCLSRSIMSSAQPNPWGERPPVIAICPPAPISACPKGHPFSLVNALPPRYPSNTFQCDQCKKTLQVSQDYTAAHCEPCSYDLCYQCYSRIPTGWPYTKG